LFHFLFQNIRFVSIDDFRDNRSHQQNENNNVDSDNGEQVNHINAAAMHRSQDKKKKPATENYLQHQKSYPIKSAERKGKQRRQQNHVFNQQDNRKSLKIARAVVSVSPRSNQFGIIWVGQVIALIHHRNEQQRPRRQGEKMPILNQTFLIPKKSIFSFLL